MSTSSTSPPVDHVDRLPDPVLLLILNLVGDVKSLGRCSAVSRRLRLLVPQVHRVLVRVDCVVSDPLGSEPKPAHLSLLLLSHLSRLLRPLQSLLGRSNPNPNPTSASVSHHSPTEVLRSFLHLRHLRIHLPSGELAVDHAVLLKWKAAFGSTLRTCVILGAADDDPGPAKDESSPDDEYGTVPEAFYTNGSLKLRIVWTISSLIAASARHFLLRQIVEEHKGLERLELTDADGQGVLCMDREQLEELRVKPVSASGSSRRTLVPALNMRLWYAPCLELAGGIVLKGASLLAIRPSEEEMEDPSADLEYIANAFQEPYGTAARLLLKRRTHCLEMNSF